MNHRQTLINLVVIILLASIAFGVSWVGLAGIAQAAPAPAILAEKAELALPPALPPTSTTLFPSTVAENQIIGTLVGTFTTDDPDTGQSYTYTFTDTGSFPDNAFFSITGDTLNTAAVFNFEATNSYTISVLTTDSGDESIVTNFVVNVTDVNEAPTNINLSPSTIAENQPISTTIGTFTQVDPDTTGSYTFTLVVGTGDDDNASFDIISGDTLVNKQVFNYEVKNSYSIRVRVTDNGGLFFEKQFTISVTDVNEAPTNINLTNSTIAENAAISTTIGTLSVVDPDTTGSYTFTLVVGTGDDDNGSFAIVGSSLKNKQVFNYEVKNSYSIRVRVTDNGGLFFEKQFTISVSDVNEIPTNINLSPSTIAENQPISTTIGTFTQVDPDTTGSYTFTLVTGTGSTDNGSFDIISGDTLVNKQVFNYEVKNSYSIRVRVTDNGGLFFEKPFMISVSDVNETPTNINLSNSTIAENQPSGTTVGTFTPVDPDTTGNYTFTLVAGTGSADNGSFNIISGNTLVTAAIFNYEVKNSYSIRVRVTDNGGLFFEKQFTISVSDVNETPTNIALSSTSVAENVVTNTVVGTFSTTDPDDSGGSDPYTYTLVSGTGSTDNGSFNINGNQLRTSSIFDYQAKNSYSIRVRTTDSGGLFFEKTFTISVVQVDPIISMTKTANPTSVPETGANVTFTIRITSSQENARLVNLSDSVFDLNTRCPTWPNYFINAGQSYTCSFTAFISGDYPGNHQNIAQATIKDNENKSDLDVGTATVTFTDVLPNLSVAYTSNPASVNQPGGNVTFSVLVTNLSTETGTLTLLQDSTFGNLSGQGSCVTGGTLAASGGTYSCSFTKLVSGTLGQTRVFTATARLADNDTNTKNVSDNTAIYIGEMPKVYLPIISKPAPTQLSVFNDHTGGTVTFTVVGTGVSCTVPNNSTLFCGSFPPGTYTVQVTSACGNATTSKTYDSGPQTTKIFCK